MYDHFAAITFSSRVYFDGRPLNFDCSGNFINRGLFVDWRPGPQDARSPQGSWPDRVGAQGLLLRTPKAPRTWRPIRKLRI